MLLKEAFSGVFLLLFSISYGVEGFAVIEGPPIVIFRPNETPVVLMCNISGAITAWRVNNSTATLPGDIPNAFPGHTVNGGNLIINTPTNNTKYICVSVESNGSTTNSGPVLLYMAATPDMVGGVMIDINNANVVNDDNVSFTLSWNEPFANFDPIVNYTVTINCTDNATCPVIVNTDNVTTTAIVNFITDLSMMTPLSVTATNTVGTSNPTIIIITVPGDVGMVDVTCGPKDVINQCSVTWNEPARGDDNVVAAPLYYNVRYFGENITNGYQRADMPMTTINFTDDNSDINSDSDVNVNVTAMNVFGSGPTSNISMANIMASSIINTTSVISDFDDLMEFYSVIVTCEIRPTSTAQYCEVFAQSGDATLTGSASITYPMTTATETINPSATVNPSASANPTGTGTGGARAPQMGSPAIMNGMATVTISQLICEQMYTITAGGITNDSQLVGPRFRRETINASSCPPMSTTSSSTPTDSTTVMTSLVNQTPVNSPPNNIQGDDDDNNTGAIVGGVVGGVCGAILIILLIILLWFCCIKKRGEKSSRATSPGGEKGGAGVKVHTLDRYGKPIPLEGENTDTGVELTGYTAKSPEFTVSQVPSTAPATTFQGNDYQTDEKNRTPSAYVPEGSYDTLAPAEEPTAPSAEVVPPSQNGQSNPNAPKLNYADLEQFTRKPASVKKPEPQPASQYAVIDPKSLQQGTYT